MRPIILDGSYARSGGSYIQPAENEAGLRIAWNNTWWTMALSPCHADRPALGTASAAALLPTELGCLPPAVMPSPETIARQVRDEFLHAWNGYKYVAWGYDDPAKAEAAAIEQLRQIVKPG